MSVAALIKLFEERHGLRVDKLAEGRLRRALEEDGGSADARAVEVLRDPRRQQAVLDGVTLQETSFFRDAPVFRDLAETVLPAAIAAAGGGRVTVWSAGCANGQEAWTLAMLLIELGAADFEVVASDVSAAAVARTRNGAYHERELRGLDAERRARFMVRAGDTWSMRPEVRRHVRVELQNASTEAAPVIDASCALVLCRYVLIYLTPEAAAALLGRIAGALAPDGRLVIGAAESLWHLSELFTAEALPHAVAYRQRRADDTGGPRDVQRRARAAWAKREHEPAPAAGPVTPAAAGHIVLPHTPRSAARSVAPTTPHDETGARTDPSAAAPDAAALVRQGEAAAAHGDLAVAAAAFRGAAYLDPEDPVAFVQLGLVLEATGDPGAERAFRSAWTVLGRHDQADLEAKLGGFGAGALVRLLSDKLGQR